MKTQQSRELIPVAKGSLLSLGQGNQVEIGCESGVIWITQDNDPRDVVLNAGESFVSDRPGTVLVYALQPAVLTANSLVERTQGSFWNFLAAKLRPADSTRGLALTSAN